MIEVESSNIRAIGYDRKSRTLRLRFLSGPAYDYEPVPPSLHKLLIEAESKGTFFREEILPNFKATKVG
jgi:hypothetical protein